MRLDEARSHVDDHHIIACQWGQREEQCAFIEIETGETDYTVHLGGNHPTKSFPHLGRGAQLARHRRPQR